MARQTKAAVPEERRSPEPIQMVGAKSGAKPTKVESRPDFVLTWQGQFQVIDAVGKVLPMLNEQPLVEGSNGLRRLRGQGGKPGAWVFTDFRAQLEDAGGILIPKDVDGRGTDYVTLAEGRNDVHLLRFHRVYPDNNRHGCDVEGYAAWVESLCRRGIVPLPDRQALEILRDHKVDRRDRYAAEAARIPSQRTEADRMTRHIEIIDAAMALLEAE